MKNRRYLQQTYRARAEHDLVFNRMGELMQRDSHLLIRGLLYNTTGISAVIVEGITASPGAGLSVDLSVPAIAIQSITNSGLTDDVYYVCDENDGTAYNVVLTAADLINPRIDIIEAQIKQRSAYTDLNVSIADPVTKTISPATRDRDFETYITYQRVTGTPAVTPTPPSPTAATGGFVLGTVDIVTAPIDLSAQSIICMAVGNDTDFVEIDCQGATPTATTAAEIVTAINSAGFGTISSLSGNFLLITAPGTGENAVIKIKSPLAPNLDAVLEILGISELPGYFNVYKGDNAWFKVTEVFVPANAVALTAGNIRSREEKDTQWLLDAATIQNGYSLEGHRFANPLDHPDSSIFINHLDSSVIDVINSKITLFRGTYAPVYLLPGDATFRQGTLFLQDIAPVKEDGNIQDNIADAEQEFPINRVDQREENFSGGSGYAVPVALSELTADKRGFTTGTAVNDGTNQYTVQRYAENHSRVGVYLTNGGSVTGFTHMRITLHNVANVSLGFADIPIADLQTLGTGWIYADLIGITPATFAYHYHFELLGVTAPVVPVLGNQSGAGADTMAFRQMYFPDAGKYGGVDEGDVVKILDNAGGRVVPIRATGADDILTPGDGFLGFRTGTNYDFIEVDFSNATFWQNWRYEDYIGIDMTLGKVKLPPSLNVRNLFIEFNVSEGSDEQDAKNILLHNRTESIEDVIVKLEDGFCACEITNAEGDFTTSITGGILDNTEAALFPSSDTPKMKMSFLSRHPGTNHARNITFVMDYAMSSSNTGVVKLDMAIRVNGVLTTARTETIDPPDTTARDRIITTSLFVDAVDFAKYDEIYIELTRDNGVGSNHTGSFGLYKLGVI